MSFKITGVIRSRKLSHESRRKKDMFFLQNYNNRYKRNQFYRHVDYYVLEFRMTNFYF